MDYDRMRAYGRWAGVVGTSGVEHDVMMRRFQIEASVGAPGSIVVTGIN